MNWAAWGPTILSIISAVFMGGILAGTIRYQGNAIKKHDKRLDGHDDKLEAHGSAITGLTGWRDGYNAAVGNRENGAR